MDYFLAQRISKVSINSELTSHYLWFTWAQPTNLLTYAVSCRGENNKGPWALGPNLGGRAPRSPSIGAQQAPRNFRGQNIENDISTVWPADFYEGS